MLNEDIKQLSLRITTGELREIDEVWRSDFNYRSRSEYLRAKIGLRKLPSEE